MNRYCLLLFISLIIISIRCHSTSDPARSNIQFYIDGTWVNKDGYSVTINSKLRTFRGTAVGHPFDHDYQLKSFHDNIIIFVTNNHKIVAQFNSEDEMTLTREDGGIPVTVTRLKLKDQ